MPLNSSPEQALLLAIGLASGLKARYRRDGETFENMIEAMTYTYLKIGGERRLLEAFGIVNKDKNQDEE